MINFKAIGSRIKSIRKKSGMTQEILAEKLNVSVEHLSRIESGAYRPSLVLLENICEVLNVDEQTLMFGASSVSADQRLTEKISLLSEEKKEVISQLVDLMI